MRQKPNETELEKLLLELKSVLGAIRSSAHCVTKNDLKETEARLMQEIKANSPNEKDLKALDALLVQSRRIAARLVSLDAQTLPK